MKRISLLLAALLFSASALAQTNGMPPTQKPAGSPGKFHHATSGRHHHQAKHRRHHKHRHHAMTRAEQRSAKVGDKPIN